MIVSKSRYTLFRIMLIAPSRRRSFEHVSICFYVRAYIYGNAR